MRRYLWRLVDRLFYWTRADGIEFWNGEPVAWVHGVAWTINFLSFFFLYPSVFNLKEVAVEKTKIHLWETGVIRITRHPQMVGQVMWSGGASGDGGNDVHDADDDLARGPPRLRGLEWETDV